MMCLVCDKENKETTAVSIIAFPTHINGRAVLSKWLTKKNKRKTWAFVCDDCITHWLDDYLQMYNPWDKRLFLESDYQGWSQGEEE